jgi:hypothetical protein
MLNVFMLLLLLLLLQHLTSASQTAMLVSPMLRRNARLTIDNV